MVLLISNVYTFGEKQQKRLHASLFDTAAGWRWLSPTGCIKVVKLCDCVNPASAWSDNRAPLLFGYGRLHVVGERKRSMIESCLMHLLERLMRSCSAVQLCICLLPDIYIMESMLLSCDYFTYTQGFCCRKFQMYCREFCYAKISGIQLEDGSIYNMVHRMQVCESVEQRFYPESKWYWRWAVIIYYY